MSTGPELRLAGEDAAADHSGGTEDAGAEQGDGGGLWDGWGGQRVDERAAGDIVLTI